MDVRRTLPGRLALLGAALVVSFWSGQVSAAVAVRVEARPVSDPIRVFVSVTDTAGRPVGGLGAGDFTLAVDGAAVPAPSITLPPAQDDNRKVSVVLAMDLSSSILITGLTQMQEAVIAFINSMQPGDYAAIVKFNASNPSKASVVQPFTQIDGAAGTSALVGAVMAPYEGTGSNVLDGTMVAIQQFASPTVTLPNGPRAVVLLSDGRDNASTADLADVVGAANQAKIPLFTIGVGNIERGQELMSSLAAQTGGTYLAVPTVSQVAGAYAEISSRLNNEYVLAFQSSITDCQTHQLQVGVTDQAPTTTPFTRCTPEPKSTPTGSGGGGGSIGLLEFAGGLVLLAMVRRRVLRAASSRRGGFTPRSAPAPASVRSAP
jgi:VWFA-related protein